MDVYFDDEDLAELYEKGKHRKYRWQKHILEKYQFRIGQLEAATSIHDLRALKSLHFERYENHFSIRVQDKYRIEFQIDFTDEQQTTGTITVLKFNNHYGH